MASSRARSRSRTRSSGRFTPPASGGGGGGSGIGSGATLLGTYATAPGTDEATPRTITLSKASTPGRDVLAIMHGSTGITSMPANWALLTNYSGGTVFQIWRLPKASHTVSFSTVQVTQGAAAYPFPMTFIEDEIATVQINSVNWTGTATTATFSNTYNSAWRNLGIWGMEKYQVQVTGAVTGYSNGLTQLSDTGPTSIYNSAHVAWYSMRTFVATVDGLSGSISLTTTSTAGNTTGEYAVALSYTVG